MATGYIGSKASYLTSNGKESDPFGFGPWGPCRRYYPFSGATFGELQRSMAAGGGGLSSPGRNEGLESAGRIASVSAGGNASNSSDMINRKNSVGVNSAGYVGGDSSGLNPNRQRGFGSTGQRIEAPTLNQMRAKQGAIVAKFMTFFKRKITLVIEMYEKSFYKQKPTWDRIADFVYNDLCSSPELRKHVQDVQFHPVKMLLFIRFTDKQQKDSALAKIRSAEGLTWSDYKVKVRGYSLDAKVKFVRLLGVSPETGEDEIRKTFLDVGIGEIIEIKKGLLDSNRLP